MSAGFINFGEIANISPDFVISKLDNNLKTSPGSTSLRMHKGFSTILRIFFYKKQKYVKNLYKTHISFESLINSLFINVSHLK